MFSKRARACVAIDMVAASFGIGGAAQAHAQPRQHAERCTAMTHTLVLAGLPRTGMTAGMQRGAASYRRAVRDAEQRRFRRAATEFLAAARLMRVQSDAGEVVDLRMNAYENAAWSWVGANAVAEARRAIARDVVADPPNADALRRLLERLPGMCRGAQDVAHAD